VGYEFFEGGIEGGEGGVVLDGVEGGVVAVVALVFPYVHFMVSRSPVNCEGGGYYQMYRNLQPRSSSSQPGVRGSPVWLQPWDTNPPPA